MNFGDSRTVAISTGNKIGLILFDGTALQRASLKVNARDDLGSGRGNHSCGDAIKLDRIQARRRAERGPVDRHWRTDSATVRSEFGDRGQVRVLARYWPLGKLGL